MPKVQSLDERRLGEYYRHNSSSRSPEVNMLRGVTLALLFLSTCVVCAAADVGRIENSAGAGVILRGHRVLPITAGTMLQLEDIVRTEGGGLIRVTLNDGSALLVSENTELRVVVFDREQEQTLVEMLHGHILVNVAPYTKPGGRFVMRTPTASVLALGTTVDVATAPATGVVSGEQLANLPTSRTTDALVSLKPGEALNKLGNPIKPAQPKNSTSQPSQPLSLLDIPPGAKLGGPGVWLGSYQGVGSTLVTGLDHFVAVSNSNPNIQGVTFLSPGESTRVVRDYGADLGGPLLKDKIWFWSGSAKKDIQLNRYEGQVYPRFRDFNVNGGACEPGVVVNGQPVSGAPNFTYKIMGMGGSTGLNSLQITVINQGPCPLYFFVPAGTGVRPKGFSKVGKAILGLALGEIPTDLKAFQDMDTFGMFVVVRPAGALGAGPAAPTGGEVTLPLRSYCVELHKLAPHPRTEYKFASEDDQKKFAGDLPVMERAVQLYHTRQLVSQAGHPFDAIVQWSLWAKIEKMGEKEFMGEFTKLVHKNYEAKKQKWDKETQKKVEASGQDLWRLVQIVLK